MLILFLEFSPSGIKELETSLLTVFFSSYHSDVCKKFHFTQTFVLDSDFLMINLLNLSCAKNFKSPAEKTYLNLNPLGFILFLNQPLSQKNQICIQAVRGVWVFLSFCLIWNTPAPGLVVALQP
jgi:hypothetical protein